MKTKLTTLILGWLAVALAAGMTGGCGETAYEGSTYYYPNWMPDGRIVCNKLVVKTSQQLYGGGL